MWVSLLDRLLTRIVREGELAVTWPDGSTRTYGGGNGPSSAVTLHDTALLHKLVMNGDLALGEAYMDETLTVSQNDLRGFFSLIVLNANKYGGGRYGTSVTGMRKSLRRIAQHNPLHTARKNVEHHYDLSTDLYELFLDQDLQYTCAYFPDPGLNIEAAQEAKKAHIAKKLLIEPGMKVMDIGCGWGGTSITLARDYGANVVGVTLSKVQLEYARKRAEAAGVGDKIEFRLIDYRDVKEEFDRIVVVGMLEHVGQPQYPTFFRKLRENLKPDGVALVHTIGRSTPPGRTSPWIHKYIFPGGYAPAMSETMREIEKQGLIATDVEVWRGHYARTLRHWQDKFETNLDAIRDLYDDRFLRMWRYYLVVSEMSFSQLGMVIFQFQLSRDQMAVPGTRDYLYTHGGSGPV
ncbi:MAG: class I SAM-dependent methyltransferase [Rhodobacteraceae bacterium]|nr:class I SAM-dependent methyltransferase [Paracoccaceae bacterium]